MTQDELNKILEEDHYFRERKKPSEKEIQFLLQDSDCRCSICRCQVLVKGQKKEGCKRYEIAHICPNRPTISQYIELEPVLNNRLGENSESIENKIILCRNCHKEYDNQTTAQEFLRLIRIKQKQMCSTSISEMLEQQNLESEIKEVVEKISNCSDLILDLSLNPVKISKKILKDNSILKDKIEHYITRYYKYVKQCFEEIDGINNFDFLVLCSEIKTNFLKIKNEPQETVFNSLVEWLKNKVNTEKKTACEIIISFFVQNCEVFYEISK